MSNHFLLKIEGPMLQMIDKDITFLEKLQLYKKLKNYFLEKTAHEKEIPENLNKLIIELDRWGKDLIKRANYYDL